MESPRSVFRRLGSLLAGDASAPAAADPAVLTGVASIEQLERRLYLGGLTASALPDSVVEPDAASDASLDEELLGDLFDEPAVESHAEAEDDADGAGPAVAAPATADPQTGASNDTDEAGALGEVLETALEAAPLFATTAVTANPVSPAAEEVGATIQSDTPSEPASGSPASADIADGPADSPNAGAGPIEAAASTTGVAATAATAEAADIDSQALTVAAAQLDAAEVETLLQRASLATDSENAIIAIVDRNGRVLGVRAEQDVLDTFAGRDDELVFAIDGAVAKARTAALFSNGEFDNDPATADSLAPLTSRTVRFISQSTITEREVNSNPNADGASLADALASTERGPGFVAPIGVGGHFPPEVNFAPPVDLFAIEHTNRDSNTHPGADGIRGTADDFLLRTEAAAADTGETLGRFNLDPDYVPDGQELFAPESFGSDQNSGLLDDAQSRGIATLPGGMPIFRDSDGDGLGDTVVGGIGVFFPGEDGYASFEQGFEAGVGQTEAERTNAPLVLESEFIAFAAIGGSAGATPWFANADVGDIGGVAAIDDIDLPFGRLDLVGVTLEVFGPGSSMTGLPAIFAQGEAAGPGLAADGTIAAGPTDSGADQAMNFTVNGFHRDGKVVPDGDLITPRDSTETALTAADIELIIDQAIAAADETRAAVGLPLGSRTKMVFAITDTSGEVLGLHRMENATTFSIDVAVAKARNVSYYADAAALEPIDQAVGVDGDIVPAGVAFTNRTFRFLAEPRFPSGIEFTDPPSFSILNDGSIDNLTAENLGAPDTVAAFDSVVGNDAFFPMTNFRDPGDASVVAAGNAAQPLANQNGIVFFPGSTPIYKDGVLVGGFGVSGDGVDQDDVVTFLGAEGFLPPDDVARADDVVLDGVRLPFQKFLRNPFG